MMRKRNRNVVYALMYGAGKKTATKIFLVPTSNFLLIGKLKRRNVSVS